jgi:hypothetical protein
MQRLVSQFYLRARALGGVCVAIAIALTASGTAPRATSQGQTRAFLIVRSDLGVHYGKFEDECPQGFEMTVEDGYLATKTPAERERLLRPENAKEYATGWKEDFITGPGGENVCNNPKSFMNDAHHPAYRGVKGSVAFGLNLDGTRDGAATVSSCGHQKFTGVDGEAGVDNQLFRAVGCAKNVRGLGPPPNPVRIDPFLMVISGIDNERNDDHVDVGIYSSDDTPLQGSDGQALPHQTLGISANPRWRATVAGRIVDGQVTTDRVEAINLHHVLPTWGPLGTNYDFEFHGARLKVSIQPDGTLMGVLAGYRPIENIFTVGRCCKGTASVANTDCASEHKTLAAMADGYPDPETGKCTMISSASNIKGIPVFIASTQKSNSN